MPWPCEFLIFNYIYKNKNKTKYKFVENDPCKNKYSLMWEALNHYNVSIILSHKYT